MADDIGANAPRLTVYCRSWCGDCRRAIAWLDEHNIEYETIDVEKDPGGLARAEQINGGTLHTPTFEMGEDVCVDFRPERLAGLLGLG